MSFDQDPNEQANISGADLAILVDELKSAQMHIKELQPDTRALDKALLEAEIKGMRVIKSQLWFYANETSDEVMVDTVIDLVEDKIKPRQAELAELNKE